MMRYSKLFSRILLRLLSEHKNKRTLKSSAYKLISLCLEKCGYTFGESIYKQLTIYILQDLLVVQHKAASIVNTSGQQKKSHKKRKTEVTNSDSLSNKLISASSTDVQVAALDTLATLLNVFGFNMENGQRSSVDGTVLSRLIQVIQPSNMSDEEVILVKAGLYQCLIASISHPIETQASILPHASRLFAAGVNDQSHQLQSLCKQGLNVCDLITHSRLPPIQRVLPKVSPAVVVTAQELEEEEESEAEEVAEEEEELMEEKPVEEIKEIKSVEITPVTLPTIVKPVTLPPVQKEVVFQVVEEVVEEIKPAEEVKPVEETKPVEESKPVEVAKPVEETKPAEEVKSTETIDISVSTTETTVAPVSNVSDDEDMDLDMPMIDMTGPDSDEEEDDE